MSVAGKRCGAVEERVTSQDADATVCGAVREARWQNSTARETAIQAHMSTVEAHSRAAQQKGGVLESRRRNAREKSFSDGRRQR